MAVRIGVGGEFFDRLREDGCYYADKTELLYELVNNTDNTVTLFTRPRRFGKTLAMSMMESFFDICRDSKSIFSGLDIMKHEEFCAAWMNRYPVLSVSFKDVEGLTFENAYGKLKTVVSDICKKYAYLETSKKVDTADANIFRRLRFETADHSHVQNSLKIIMRMMKAVHGRPVIFLVDEYDVPLAKADEEKEGGERYYPQMLEIVRGIMSAALKSNEHLKFGVVTGCLRIAKESIFTGVNNFKSYSVLDSRFSTYFGFTEEDVANLLSAADLTERIELVRSWYDGYVFGKTRVFCPWDVVNYVADVLDDPELEPDNYWKNTSSNGIIRSFVERTEFKVNKKFETLLNGGSIDCAISDDMTYDTVHGTEDNLWSLLLMTGYLTKADPRSRGKNVELIIPNKEIAGVFQDTVMRFFYDHVDSAEQKSMMECLWAGDESGASEAISKLLWQTISYMDYHEDYYHAFLVGIFVRQGYEVESNRERGLGRPDIRLTDDVGRRMLIIAAKKSDREDQMEHDCEKALKQIADKEYAKNPDGYAVTCYGMAFFRKRALLKKLR